MESTYNHPLPPSILAEIAHYSANGWEPRIIARLASRHAGRVVTAQEIKELCEAAARERAEKNPR